MGKKKIMKDKILRALLVLAVVWLALACIFSPGVAIVVLGSLAVLGAVVLGACAVSLIVIVIVGFVLYGPKFFRNS